MGMKPKRLFKNEINEIRKKIQDVKEVLNKDMENHTKKNQTETLETKIP
jgi:hypothetical protein